MYIWGDVCMFKVIKLKSIIAAVILALIAFLGLKYFTYRLAAVNTSAGESGQKVLIVMYHSILKDAKSNQKYIISSGQFEQDIEHLKDNGFEFVTFTDLINYVKTEEASLPSKPVVITFDDGFYNNYEYAYPIMKKLDAPFVISVVGEFSDGVKEDEKLNVNYSYLPWEAIREMNESGLVEIQNHSYNMHNLNKGRRGAKKAWGESYEAYEKVLAKDVMKMQELLTERSGVMPNTFTYPFGEQCRESEEILKKLGFEATVSAFEGISRVEKGNPESLFTLLRYNRPGGKSSEAFFKKKIELMETAPKESPPPEVPVCPAEPVKK